MRQSCLTILLAIPLLAASCRTASPSAANPAPPAEFLLAAGDSSFWVSADSTGVTLRGVPLDIALVNGRFVEFYVVDDDRSYQDADLIGQSVYRRDLRTGDSTLVFTDSIVPALAREYGATHPSEVPLASGDEPDPDPVITATATIELGEAHGPFVSFSLHTDVERQKRPLWHASRRGVLDMRTGHQATIDDIAGPDAPRLLREASAAAGKKLDLSSFSIVTINGAPAVAFADPGAGTGKAGEIGAITSVAMHSPDWWAGTAPSLPVTSADGSRKVWRHASYSVVARSNDAGTATLFLRDSASREWPVGTVSTPATRIYWLDTPAIDAETRRALQKAFNDAASYGNDHLIALNDK